jgi:colicin import membrane protein
MPESSSSLDQLRREHRRTATEERELGKAIAARQAAETAALAEQRADFQARELALKKRVADLERRLHEALGRVDRQDKALAALERRRKEDKEEATAAAKAAAEEREASAAREREREREAAAEAEAKAKAAAAAIKAAQMQLESARLDADVQRAAHEAAARRAARAVAVARAEAAEAKAAAAAAASAAEAAASAQLRDQVEHTKQQHERATEALLAERDAEIARLRRRLRALEEEALALARDDSP